MWKPGLFGVKAATRLRAITLSNHEILIPIGVSDDTLSQLFNKLQYSFGFDLDKFLVYI